MDIIVSCILPYDVLVNIFQYLPLKDRKNVRLTCHLWNDSCHHPTIVKLEKFVFHPGVTRGNAKGTVVCIANCRTLRSNFEFYALAEIPSIVWTKCGNQITSLYFNECVVDNKTVKNVILYCPNLITLRITSLYLIHDWKADCLCLSSTFDELISLGIKRENLITFELFTSTSMPEEEVKKLFKIYPQIQTFRHGCWLPESDSKNIWPLRYDDEGVHSHYLSEELLCSVPIKNFTFNFWMVGERMELFDPILGVKFKELEVTMSDEDVSITFDTLMDFFLNQTELEKLSLRVTENLGSDLLTLLPHILEKLSKLKILKLHADIGCITNFVVPEFMRFMNSISNLESLDISPFRVCYLDPMELVPSPSEKFVHLKALRLERADQQVILQILKSYCSCLSILHLDNVNDQILQAIFEHHTKLIELEFACNFHNCTSAGFTGMIELENAGSPCNQTKRYSFGGLQNLERLALMDGLSSPENYEIFAAFLSEFNFPRLKHFQFYKFLDTLQERRLLRTVSSMAPCLETLEMRSKADDGLDLVLLIKYCRRMERLKCVKFVSRSSVAHYKQLFTECPSLINVFTQQKLTYRGGVIVEERIFFYDRVSRTLTSVV